MLGEQNLNAAVTVREPTAEERSHAVRAVAGEARDAADLAELLDMLGLAASEARTPGSAPDQLARASRDEELARRRNHRLTVEELGELFAGAREAS